MLLKDKVAIISGAASKKGIGLATARLFSAHGCRVAILDRDENMSIEAANSLGNGHIGIGCDVSDRDACRRSVNQVIDRFGCVDILINNAGFGWYGYLKDMPWSEADDLLRVNIVALTRLTQAFMPQMTARNSGHIINLGSIVGVMPNQGIALYSGSKAYVDAFTTALHRELRGTQVHAGVIRPGPVKTEFFDLSAKLPGSTRIPGEQLAATSAQVADEIIRQLNHPKRFRFVPGWMRVTAWVEFYFG